MNFVEPLKAKFEEHPEYGSFGRWSRPPRHLRWSRRVLEEGIALDRRKRSGGRGTHGSPVVVEPTPGGHVARCLVCGISGPVRPDSEGAMRALKNATGHREKMGA